MDIGVKSFIVVVLYLHKMWSKGMDICIAEFQSKDGFDVIPALACLGGLADGVWVRLCDLALARHMQLSVMISAVVSMSMNQSPCFRSPAHQMWGYLGVG